MDGGEKKEVRRPMNAFLIFCKRHRGFVREKNPDMDNRSVTRVLGDLWANLGEEKKIYTNLAKQYKDAFMKANPNYKWHSAEKSQSSSAKIISKPTNSRVIKNVAEIHTDGIIIPGKLADLDKMGGLNLLLMADKETCDSRNLSSSAPFSLTRTSTASSSPSPVQTSVGSTEQSSTSNSALLQLAEMCASELRGSSDDKPIQYRLTPLTLAIPPSSLSLLDSPEATHQAMPPPKKRARHWSLTEADSAYETTNDNGSREYIFGNVSLQNASLQKLRCTSVGSSVYSEDKFSSLEKYKPPPPRRKLSSSATESIPSPSGPFGDDADSPVFSPETSFSGDSKLENECFDQIHRNLSQWSKKMGKIPVSISEVPSHHSPMNLEDHSHNQKLLKPKKQTKVTVSLHPPSASAAGVIRPGLWQERKEQPISEQVQHSHRHGLLVPLHPIPSLGVCEDREMDARLEMDSSPNFYTWREPGKSKSKVVEVSPGSLNLKVISNSATEPSPLPLLRLNQHDGNLLEYKNQQQSLARFESAGDAKISSSVLSGQLPSASSSCSVSHEDTSFSSVLSERRITSVLNNLDAPTAKFPLKFSHSTTEALATIDDNRGQNEFLVSTTNEIDTCYRIKEPDFPTKKMISSEVAKNIMFNLETYNPKMIELGNMTAVIPSTIQSQTFSEGKLKKKWAERMLIESRLNEDLTHQQVEGVMDALTKNDPSNVVKSSPLETDANQNISQMESKLESSKLMKPIDGLVTRSFSSEPGDLKMSTAGHCSLSTLNILNQPICSLEGTQNHPRSPKLLKTSSHTKLMLHTSLDPQTPKLSQSRPQICSDEAKIKLEPNSCGTTISQQDQKLVHRQANDSNFNYKNEHNATNSEEVHNNKITTCGKRFMDHAVDQLCKTDISANKQLIETKGSRNCVAGDFSQKSPFTEVKSEPGKDFEMGFKEETTVNQIKAEEKKDIILASTVSSAKKVHGSPPQTEGFSTGRKSDQETSNINRPFRENKNCTPLSSNDTLTSNAEESSRKWETCRRAATSPSSDACFQNQWTTTVVPESCDQSDLNEEAGIQPLRKSRRPNRGQKYQELIKEGFIQPSRERLAARNADRHGRSFGTREEFEKMEMKRILKRSASERDTPSESPAVPCNSGTTAASDASVENRFTSGDFDLEKEIESLPVCSLDQLDKKKVMRRRCDSDTLGSPPSHRSSGDATNNLTRTSSGSQTKLSPHTSSASKFEAVDLCEPGCPAPHIPLPKEERPTEPITGSRKRKARKHCITRISILDEKTSMANTAVRQKCVQPIPSEIPQKKLCSLPSDIPHSSVMLEGNKNTSDSSRIMSRGQMTSLVKLDSDKVVSETGDLKIGSFDKTASAISLAGNVAPVRKALDIVAMSNFSAISSTKNGLTLSSSPQLLSALSVVPPTKAASLLLSDKHCGSHPALTAFKAHKKNKATLLSPIPTTSRSTSTIIPKSVSTGTIRKTSASKASSTITDHPILLETEYTYSLIQKINSEESHKQSVTLSASKIKIPPVHVLTSKELPAKKCVERKPKKIKENTSETSAQNLQSTISKSQCTLKRKFTEKKITPVLSRSSNTPLVSALLGHSDLSSVIKLAERGDGQVMALKTTSSGKSNSAYNAVSPTTLRVDFSSPVLSAIKSHLNPLNIGQSHIKTLVHESPIQNIISKSILSSPKSTHRAAVSTSTTETSPYLSTTSSPNDRLPYSAASKCCTSLIYKAHESMLLPTALTSSFINETVDIKPQQCSMDVSQLPVKHASLIAASCSSSNPDTYSSRTYASIPHTGAILHNSLLNQVPSAVISSSSAGICTTSSEFVSSASPLLSLIPPPHSSSSSSILPPTVISLATSSPSSKTDIVSYTVIGSSTVIDAGSPHMIGSSHLTEPPTVAIVKS